MKHADVLTLKWTGFKWSTNNKEQINNVWLQSAAFILNGLKKCKQRLLFPSKVVYNQRFAA